MSRSERLIVEDRDGSTLYQSEFRPVPMIVPHVGEVCVVQTGERPGELRRQDGKWLGGVEFRVVERRLAFHAVGSLTHLLVVEPLAE
jgi:hypothetical protein